MVEKDFDFELDSDAAAGKLEREVMELRRDKKELLILRNKYRSDWDLYYDDMSDLEVTSTIRRMNKAINGTLWQFIELLVIVLVLHNSKLIGISNQIGYWVAVAVISFAINRVIRILSILILDIAVEIAFSKKLRGLENGVKIRKSILLNYTASKLKPSKVVNTAKSSIIPEIRSNILMLRDSADDIKNKQIRDEFLDGLSSALSILELCERDTLLMQELSTLSASFNIGIEKLYNVIESTNDGELDEDVLMAVKKFSKFMGDKLADFKLLSTTNKGATIKALETLFES